MLKLAIKAVEIMRRWRLASRRMQADIPFHRKFSGPDFPPLLRRILEQSLLLVSNGIVAPDYYTFGLYDKSRPWREKQSFHGSFEVRERPLFELFTKRAYWSLLDDKVVFSRYFEETGLPAPKAPVFPEHILRMYERKQAAQKTPVAAAD